MARVVIVKPGDQKRIYGQLGAFDLTAFEPPLWAALLGSLLRSVGHDVLVLDAEIEGWDAIQTAQAIRETNPLLAVISVSGSNPSASTMNMTGALELSHALRTVAPGVKTILHGLHPSALPARSLTESSADFLCQGEGFYTLPALVLALQSTPGDFRIPGLWTREGGRACGNPPSPVFSDLDALPMPAWDLLPMSHYRAHNWHCFGHIEERQPYGVIYTSLGCPFDCSFCCINTIFGKPGIRYRSPGKVIEEIDMLVNRYGIRNIKIMDELFALNEARVMEICDLLIERNYGLNIWAYARVNTVTPRMLAHMKKAGIVWVAYGFESASNRVLKDVGKRYEVEMASKVVEMTYEAGLHIVANFIFGLPEDDFDTMQQTLGMAMDMNAEWLNIYPATAYPGSRLYDQAVANQWQLPGSWSEYSPYAEGFLPLPTRHLTAGEVLAFRDYAFNAYYTNPRYLDRMRKLFGMETVGHIQQMTRHTITRRHGQFSG